MFFGLTKNGSLSLALVFVAQFPLSVFVFIDSSFVSASQDEVPGKITSSCIWIIIPVDSVILYWYAYGADGRTGGRSRDYQNFSDGWITTFS